MSSSSSRKCKSICNWPYSFKHFKRPTVSRWQLGTNFKLQGALPWPHSKVTMIPNVELFVHFMLFCIALLFILGCFQVLHDLCNLFLHFLEKLWTKHNHVHWIIPSHRCPTSSSIQSFVWTHSQWFLFSIVIWKFHQVWIILPLGWFFHYIHAKHVFKNLIYSLSVCSSVWLW